MKRRIFIWRRIRGLFLEERWRILIGLPDGETREFRRRGEKGARDFAADPFLVVRDGVPHLFYETTRKGGKGVLACSHLADGRWVDDGIVLERATHLSYPQVFEHAGDWYMIPESGEANEVALYRAADFPARWEKVSTLLEGRYADSTLLVRDAHFYLFALNRLPGGRDVLELWHADRLAGPWRRHPATPVQASRRLSRPAGRCFVEGGRLFRVAQDCNGDYGKRVFRVPILALSPTEYEEGDGELLLAPPAGFAGAHTYGRVEVDGASWRVTDAKRFFLLPARTALANLWNCVAGRLFRHRPRPQPAAVAAKMKVLILSTQRRTENTGVRVYCDSLEDALRNAGRPVVRLTHHECRPPVRRLCTWAIRATRLLGRDFQRLASLAAEFVEARDALRPFRPDEWVVLAQDPLTGAAASRRGFRTAVTCHFSDPCEEIFRAMRFGACAKALTRRFMCRALAQNRNYAALTRTQGETLRVYCPNAAVTVIPTICRVRPGLPPVPHAGFRIVMTGRLEFLKGQDRLVEALPLVTRRDCEVWLVGDGEACERLAQTARRLAVDGRVRFCGQSARPDDLMRECDLYVHASRMEAMSLSPIEAVFAGIPAWCYETPGFNDFGLFDGMPRLTQQTTARELAAAIDGWIAQGREAARARWAAQFAKAACFSPERAAVRYGRLIEEICS